METLRYSIYECSMHYFYSETGASYWDIFLDGSTTPVKRFPAGTTLEIHLDQTDYLVDELADLPAGLETVLFVAEDGVLSFSSAVQNREAFGIEDFRDCARSHYWDLSVTPDFSFFVYLPQGDSPQLVLGCPAALAPLGYSQNESCKQPA